MSEITLKNIGTLRVRIQEFNAEKNMERLSAVLMAFCDSEVLLPVTGGKKGVEITEVEGHQYLLVFTGEEELHVGFDENYRGVKFDPLMITELAMANQAEGLLIDGFTAPFLIPANVFGFIRSKMQQSASAEDAMREVGILSTDMLVRIAVPYDTETGEVFGHFGHCPAFKIYDVDDGDVVSSKVVDPDSQGHSAITEFLVKENVNFVICGGIGGGAVNALKEAGIKLFAGVNENADDAVNELLACLLEYDPNPECGHHHEEGHCCGHHHHEEGHCCGHHHHEEGHHCEHHHEQSECGCHHQDE